MSEKRCIVPACDRTLVSANAWGRMTPKTREELKETHARIGASGLCGRCHSRKHRGLPELTKDDLPADVSHLAAPLERAINRHGALAEVVTKSGVSARTLHRIINGATAELPARKVDRLVAALDDVGVETRRIPGHDYDWQIIEGPDSALDGGRWVLCPLGRIDEWQPDGQPRICRHRQQEAA